MTMDVLADYDGRITAALDRIRTGLNALGAAPLDMDGASIASLRGELEAEREANAQLEERVRQLKERQDGRIAQLEADLEKARDVVAALDGGLQGLRQTNADLRALTAALRTAAAESVAEAELINRAILAELDATKAAQAADRAELDAVLAELMPHLTQTETA
jgi:chromosome segregation ATPase